MPILTEEELQDIKKNAREANQKAEEKNQQLIKACEEKKRINQQRVGFLVSTLILGILLLAVFFQPALFNLSEKKSQLDEGEVIINESTVKDYENQISELQSKNSKYTNPLELNEFYAVQLGAFKTFNTDLSSDDFSVVHNANFKDFKLYTLGVFKTEEEAEKLRKVVSKLNFKDAFVGLYRNGERVESNY